MPIRQSAEQRLHELNSAEAYLGAAARTLAALNSSQVSFGDAVDEAVRRSPALQFAPGSEPEWISTLRELIERERASVLLSGTYGLPFYISMLERCPPANEPLEPRDAVMLAKWFENRLRTDKNPDLLKFFKEPLGALTWEDVTETWGEASFPWGTDVSEIVRGHALRVLTWFKREKKLEARHGIKYHHLYETLEEKKKEEEAARKRLENHLERVDEYAEQKRLSLRDALTLAALARERDRRKPRE